MYTKLIYSLIGFVILTNYRMVGYAALTTLCATLQRLKPKLTQRFPQHRNIIISMRIDGVLKEDI